MPHAQVMILVSRDPLTPVAAAEFDTRKSGRVLGPVVDVSAGTHGALRRKIAGIVGRTVVAAAADEAMS